MAVPVDAKEKEKEKERAEAEKKRKEKEKEEELSEEDKELKENLELCVARVAEENDAGVQRLALETMRKEIRESTSSMTSVPKPLKFLRPHYDTLKNTHNKKWPKTHANRKLLADVLSVLAMAFGAKGANECLSFRLEGTAVTAASPEPAKESNTDIGAWGHEYVKHLAGEIGSEFNRRLAEPAEPVDPPTRASSAADDELMALVKLIVPFHLIHNGEPDAVDLLIEVDALASLPEYVEEKNSQRTCLYLLSIASYLSEPDDDVALNAAYTIYTKCGMHQDAMRVALKRNAADDVVATFVATKDAVERKQLCYLLARHGFWLDFEDGPAASCFEDGGDSAESLREALQAAISNARLSENYLSLARDLDVMEPKAPEDVYKSHLVEGGRSTSGSAAADSAQQNLAATYVNAFVNAGFGQDKLMLPASSGSAAAGSDGADGAAASEAAPQVQWIYKNKEHGKTSAAGSIGMLLMWDVEGGLPQIDKYLYSTESHVNAGALLAVGMINANVRNECDPAYALLYDSVGRAKDLHVRTAAMLGLGIAYAGCRKEEVSSLLVPIVTGDDDDEDAAREGGASTSEEPLEVQAYASLAMGMVFVSTCDEDCTQALISALMARSTAIGGDDDAAAAMAAEDTAASGGGGDASKDGEGKAESAADAKARELSHDPLFHLLSLGLGLLFLGCGSKCDATMEVLKATLHPTLSSYVTTALESCAYAGSGNVLMIQKLLATVGEHPEETPAPEGAEEEERPKDKHAHPAHQPLSVLALALIGMSEDIGGEMLLRSFEHLLQYGEPCVRKAVPLAVALLCVSQPKVGIIDMLSRLSHDTDAEVAQSAIFALGIASAGTNNARVANILRQLSGYYYKDPSALFLVRISQGLAHMGKGLLTLSPHHSDRLLISNVALAGLLTVLFASLDMSGTLLSRKHHVLLYVLSTAMNPRMLMTLDGGEAGKALDPSEAAELVGTNKPLPIPARVGEAVDVVAQAGKPKTVTGFQTHVTPVLLNTLDRAELGTDEYLPVTSVLEGFVLVKKNPDFQGSGAASDEKRKDKK